MYWPREHVWWYRGNQGWKTTCGRKWSVDFWIWVWQVYNFEVVWVPRALPFQFSSVQSLGRVPLFATPWITACQASLSITISWSSLILMSIKSVMPSSHLILCHSPFLLPSIPLSISLFQWVNSSHEVAKVLEFQLELKIPLALRPKSQNIKQKQYCNKFNEDFKLGPHF